MEGLMLGQGGNFKSMGIEGPQKAGMGGTGRPRSFVTGSLGEEKKRLWNGKGMGQAFLSGKGSGERLLNKPIFSRSSRKKENMVVIDSGMRRANELIMKSLGGNGSAGPNSRDVSMKNLNPRLYNKINGHGSGGKRVVLRPGIKLGSGSMSNEFLNSR
jgi:hypothetical protein